MNRGKIEKQNGVILPLRREVRGEMRGVSVSWLGELVWWYHLPPASESVQFATTRNSVLTE